MHNYNIFLVLLLLSFPLSANAQADSTDVTPLNDTTIIQTDSLTENSSFPKSVYVICGLGFYGSEDVYIGRLFSCVFGANYVSNVVALEIPQCPFGLVYFSDRKPNTRLPLTPLAQIAALSIPWSIGNLFNISDENTSKYILPLTQIPFGLHVNIQPVSPLSFYGGYSTDYLVGTLDDGVLFQYRIGSRLRLSESGIVLSIEGVKTRFWAWENESKSFGWGVGLYISIENSNSR